MPALISQAQLTVISAASIWSVSLTLQQGNPLVLMHSLKGQFTQKSQLCDYLFTLMLFQTCMIVFFL